jgi:hypothetical protein
VASRGPGLLGVVLAAGGHGPSLVDSDSPDVVSGRSSCPVIGEFLQSVPLVEGHARMWWAARRDAPDRQGWSPWPAGRLSDFRQTQCPRQPCCDGRPTPIRWPGWTCLRTEARRRPRGVPPEAAPDAPCTPLADPPPRVRRGRKALTPLEAAVMRERRAAVLAGEAKKRQGARNDLHPEHSPKLGECKPATSQATHGVSAPLTLGTHWTRTFSPGRRTRRGSQEAGRREATEECGNLRQVGGG